MQFKTPQPRSRAKYDCPEGLANFIELAKRVDPNVTLPYYKDVVARYFLPRAPEELSDEEVENGWAPAIRDAFGTCLKNFPDDVREMWLNSAIRSVKKRHDVFFPVYPNEDQLLTKAMQIVLEGKYSEFRDWRAVLFEIARYFGATRNREKSQITNTLRLPKMSVMLSLDGPVLRVVSESLADALNGAVGDRIRTCAHCGRLFWANRKDSTTDSKACLDILRQRDYRKENAAKIAARRRAKRKLDKEGEAS